MVVEVFKTNVNDPDQGKMLLHRIKATFQDYNVNFDLEDCDRILRVETIAPRIEVSVLIAILKDAGFDAEILPDDMPELLQF